MNQTNSFKIYDASAGSGKTFTLVKAYLSLILGSSNPYKFQRILAITFTNKAVGEMKYRIIECLKLFSKPDIIESKHFMFNAIASELNIEKLVLSKRATTILNTILHNYAALNISTIDGFNHRLIRTFAHDLKLPVNFEVELDTVLLLQKAVDVVISKAGVDKELTKILIEFAIEKADDDKSWDISKDLNEIALLLINENHLEHLNEIELATLTSFEALKSSVSKQRKEFKKILEQTAKNILETLENSGVDKVDFLGKGTVWNHFLKVKINADFYTAYGKTLETNVNEGKLYAKALHAEKKVVIDGLQQEIKLAFQTVKSAYYQHKFYTAIYKNITPLSLLNQIKQTLSEIKKEDNKMLISEFNSIISTEIKKQPIPFIYERIGERFQNYFIDEFQDTSELQWTNLTPLIDNTLSTEYDLGEKGTAMIVGDAKQAIYRWRGGKAEQFLGLINEVNPFIQPKEVVKLDSNYRSHEAIINFNNGLFLFVSEHCFGSEVYKDLYENAPQKLISEQEGFVNVSFLDYRNKEEAIPQYCDVVLKNIEESLSLNYRYQDICILVRKKDEAKTLANFLGGHEIPFTSSDSLLLKNAVEVNFINALLQFIVTPSDIENKLVVLDVLANRLNIEDKHVFYSKHIHLENATFLNSFKDYGFNINLNSLKQLPLYELVETLVRKFNLVNSSNAYVQFYLETVFEFTQKASNSIQEFLDYFELNSKKLKISTANESNAVKIMTIHSSKGLEFPVVIYPFVDLNIYSEIKPKEWVGLEHVLDLQSPIDRTLLDYTKDFENYNVQTKEIFMRHKNQQELDVINVFYVALTRAVERLYIIAKKDKTPKLDSYQGILYSYLEKSDFNLAIEETVCFGNHTQKASHSETQSTPADELEFISVPKEHHGIQLITSSGALWGTAKEEALQKGNAIHAIMERVQYANHLDDAITYQIAKGEISKKDASQLKPLLQLVINHPELKTYYTSDFKIFNETDLLSNSKSILRPDRFVIKENLAVIIDYKTGLKNPKYKEQLYSYKLALESIGFKVEKSLLVYINDVITVEEV
jgi:ATP-dependent exoDNAse (exonuclease V) beta subunit